MRRLATTLAGALACLSLPLAPEALPPPDGRATGMSGVGSWAEPQIRAVVGRSLMGGSLSAFRPDDALTVAELNELAAALARRAAPSPPATRPSAASSAAATIEALDGRLVRTVGLSASASRFTAAAKAAGLDPPARFGTEVVARLLGLRTNHPAAQDDLELLPRDPATRAEAAFSAARVLALSSSDVRAVTEAAAEFQLPALDEWQRRVLTVAVGLVGYPYIWAGTSERGTPPSGGRGGFDCSGFVWRVFKLHRYPEAAALAGTLRGRTTYAMSGEVPTARRVPFPRLEPADVVFFGRRGTKSRPAEVDHVGIYLGSGWIVHSSERGVALARMSGWYRERFAWGRRPLAEAGLVPA